MDAADDALFRIKTFNWLAVEFNVVRDVCLGPCTGHGSASLSQSTTFMSIEQSDPAETLPI